MSQYARKVDDNQAEIIRALRRGHHQVVPMNRLPSGFPDLIVCRAGYSYFLEIKALKGGRLTAAQKRFHQAWMGPPIRVVRSVDEAFDAVAGKY